MWRAPGLAWWRPVVAIVFGAVMAFLVALAFSLVYALGVISVGGRLEGITPGLFLTNNLSLAALIGVGALVSVWPMRQAPRWLASVVGRIRWRWLGQVALVTLLILAASNAVNYAMAGGLPPLSVQPHTWSMLIIILTTQALQSAGEEVAFRGVLNRGIASLIPNEWYAVIAGGLVSSIAFMFVHGAGDPWLNLYYMVFGGCAAFMTWRTGGLEAAIAVHSVNNLLALALVPFSDMSALFSREAGVGSPWMLVDCGVLLGLTCVVTMMAKRFGVQRLCQPPLKSGQFDARWP